MGTQSLVTPQDAHGQTSLLTNLDNPASVLSFRSFQVVPGARLLLRDGKACSIGGRAFDLLVVLLKARGTVVGKSEIFDKVWPDLSVDESNLRFQMGYLRRALGPDRDVIKTVQGRGYLLATEPDPGATERMRVSDEELQEVTASLPAKKAGDPPLVAIIDDDESLREALEGLLRSSGLQVECFNSVQAFLDAGGPSQMECLVLDVWMPGRSGLELQSDLAQCGIDVPIVFISGHADVHMSVRAMKAGAAEFLTKPVRHEDLLEAIHGAVSAPRLHDEKVRNTVVLS